jgi:ubiquinol-cytochrome c reductase cytochrome c subunit
MRHHVIIAALATVAAMSPLGATSAFAASAEHGKTMFMKKGCWECHGTQGQGAVTGPRLAPDPMPYETLAYFVRNTARAMPPYREKVLSDADLADIYAYLQSIPKAPNVDSIPLLGQWSAKPK